MRIIKRKRRSSDQARYDSSNQNMNSMEIMEKVPSEKSLDSNLEYIKGKLKDCSDIVYREFFIGEEKEWRLILIYTDGLVDKSFISDFILKSLMFKWDDNIIKEKSAEKIYQNVKNKAVAVADISEIEDLNEALLAVLSGDTVLITDGTNKILKLSTRGWPTRGVEEPNADVLVRGPRDGFTETLRFNTALVRRRIRDPKLKMKAMKIGRRSQTDVVIAYIEDIVNREVLQEVEKRLNSIDIDAVLDSGYIEQLIEDNWKSIFPQVQSTERPDKVTAALYEGRVAILVDNTPFALIVPVTLGTLFQSPEDYYERWLIGTLTRIVRYGASFLAIILPSLYVAFTGFHPGIMPTQLTLFVAGTREDLPFPIVIEVVMMELAFELLREAGIRLPGPIGEAMGIVGGIIIGQAAVQARIVSPLMVIVVATTAIASFAIPSYNLAIAYRIYRFILIVFAALLGLYGVVLGAICILTHLICQKSFGIPYLAHFITYAEGSKKDVIRAPMPSMHKRPGFYTQTNKVRMQDKRKEEFESIEKGGGQDGQQ